MFVKIDDEIAKKLATSCNVTTLEELYLIKKETITAGIKNKYFRKKIFSLKEQIIQKVNTAKHRNILLFDERARDKNIKIHSSQRAKLIGITLFSRLLNDIEGAIHLALDMDNNVIPFRKKALLFQLKSISKRCIQSA